MYSLDRSNCFTRTTLPLSLARGGTAYIVALLLVCLLMIPSVCYCETSGDIFTTSNSKFQDGSISVGFFNDGAFLEYNTKYVVCPGVIGWCFDKCPGPEGDVSLNTTQAPITRNGFTWEPGVLYVNAGFDQRGVAIRFKPSKSQSIKCAGSFAVKPDGTDEVTVQITKNATPLTTVAMDSGQNRASTLLSTVTEATSTDTIYFTIRNPEHERCGLVGVQLYVTPDADKFDPTGSIKKAFATAK